MIRKASLSVSSMPRPLLIGVLVVALVLAAPLAGKVAASRPLLGIAALGGSAGLLLVAGRSQLAVLLVPISALFIPWSLPTGTESRVHLSMVLVGALTALALLQMLRGRLAPAPSLYNRPLVAMMAIWTISLVWGRMWWDPRLIYAPKFVATQVGQLVTTLLSFAALLLMARLLTTRRQIWMVIGGFLLAGLLGALIKQGWLPAALDSFVNTHGIFSAWFGAIAFAILLFVPLRASARLPLLALTALSLYQRIIVDNAWVSGWLPAMVALLAVLFVRTRRGFLVVLLLCAMLIARNYAALYEQVVVHSEEEGDFERLGIWEQNWQITSQHLLFGTGPAGYAIYTVTYFPEDARSTHNNYLDILSQTGLLGSLALLWFILAGLRECRRLLKLACAPADRAVAAAVTGGLLAALAAMLFGDWVLPFAYNQGIAGYSYTVYTWLWLGLGVALRRLLEQERGLIEKEQHYAAWLRRRHR